MMLQLCHCLLFISLGTVICFPVRFKILSDPIYSGKSSLVLEKARAAQSNTVHLLPGYTTLLVQTSSGKGHQEEEQPPKDARALEFQQEGGDFDHGWDRQTHHPKAPGQDQPHQNYSCNPALDNHLGIEFDLHSVIKKAMEFQGEPLGEQLGLL